MVTVKLDANTDVTIINPTVEPDIAAVTFGADANAVENVTVSVPPVVVVPVPYKYLVTLIDDTFAASRSMPALNVLGTVEAQMIEVEGK